MKLSESFDLRLALNVYTDGACIGNPGPGGWGVFIEQGANIQELSGYDCDTTNNRMELTAAIKALSLIPDEFQIILHTDSTYVKNGITSWIKNWKKNSWKTKTGPVKNPDLWKELDKLSAIKNIRWEWVRGHSGNEGNERADSLAQRGVNQKRESSNC